MPVYGPISRPDLIRTLKLAGYSGPYSGGRHQFMIREQRTVRIPNPHCSDIGIDLLSRILKQCGISREHWESL